MSLLDDYFDFLRIPSISADPAHNKDLVKCCNWVANYINDSGLKAEVWETPRAPAVYAHYKKNDGPTLLIYGHYDVQPVDPLDEWESDPFEPTVRDGQVYARGAQDNKGQILYTLCAIRELLKEKGELPLNIKLLIEGEEETKSLGLTSILQSKKKELQADYLVSPDFGMYSLDKPIVTLGLRGMAAITVELRGSTTDLHSGFGGIPYNPNHALVKLLADLRDDKGRVTLPGFYDDIIDLPTDKLDLTIDTKAFPATCNGGEVDYTPGESSTIRPTLEINGISGGYSGPGFKTVIPATATAKISCRLVPGQDPDKIIEALTDYFKFEGMEVTVTNHGGGRAVRANPDTPPARALAKAYTEVLGKPCIFSLTGGSVPITAELSEVSGAIPTFCGYGLLDDQIHAPNEHFGLDRMELGRKTIKAFLKHLAST